MGAQQSTNSTCEVSDKGLTKKLGLNDDSPTAVFTINGNRYEVSDLPVSSSLNGFIRDNAHLTGTKFMCYEGGCGACIVSVTAPSPDGGGSITFSINSCLVPVYACHGLAIETIEALGNKKKGFGKIQSTLACYNGSQCGYCSPGMIMNMYSLLKNKPDVTMMDVENSFGGNICRCTGYRPILDAFKSLAKDGPKNMVQLCSDMEEFVKICPKTSKECSMICTSIDGKCSSSGIRELPLVSKKLKLELSDGNNWYRVTNEREILEIFEMIRDNSYILLGGNTAHGVYYNTNDITNYIDINGVRSLHTKDVSGDSLVLGANVTLTDAMEFFNNAAKLYKKKFGYVKTLAKHIDLIANVPVRNIGTLAGNLTIKHDHKEFPSDIFIMLEGAGAQLTIDSPMGTEEVVSLMQYLSMDMNKKLITNITLPALDSSKYVYGSYKIMPRAQNAHAYVNAAFLVKLDRDDGYKIIEKPNIVFGGINKDFVHADDTESYLNGKRLLDVNTLQAALKILSSELHPEYTPPEASAEYRKGLAISLFYKFVLSVAPDKISQKNRSGGSLLHRPLSSGKQEFETNKKLWPLNQPIPKIEAYTQCSGEAEYINDISTIPGELCAALVVSQVATAESFTLDASEALKIPGVVAFYSAKDIPGDNDFMSPKIVPESGFVGEEVFASKNISFAGQALGVIVAENFSSCFGGVAAVRVHYSGVKKPKVDMVEIIKSGIKERIVEQAKIEPTVKKGDLKHKVAGSLYLHGQYHFTMETQSCFCVPTENGMDVYPSTQWPAHVQGNISNVLKVHENSINISVRRLGGAYGSKISRNAQISAICALACHLTNHPVRLTLSMETNMQMIGKRFPCYMEYEVYANDSGEIQKLSAKIYGDVGVTLNEASNVPEILRFMKGTYDSRTWSVTAYSVQTDTPSNTWARGPGSTEAACCINHIMEHIASVLKTDPICVRLANIIQDQNPLVKLIKDIKGSSGYDKRLADIDNFNRENRWKKRGICLLPVSYPLNYFGRYHATVTVYGNSGTVAISHGGIECGQGLNTKVAQVCAYTLGIPLEFVKVNPNTTFISPNNATTGGSQTSEAVCYAVIQASKEILERLEPIRKTLPPGSEWVTVVRKACSQDTDLKASHMYKSAEVESYNIYTCGVSEVELDILTGQVQITQVHILEDAGQSLSPEVDIGQVEGAFIMGLGYYLTEKLVYDKDTGKLLTNRTWNYKPPGAKDIPINFHIELLKSSRNPYGVLRSKATGEPPLNLSCGITFAIRKALESARKDAGKKEAWFNLEYPVTPEQIWLSGSTEIKGMLL